MMSVPLFDASEFEKINAEEAPQAERLAAYLIRTFHPHIVVDIGCATGLYLKPFYDVGISVFGYEISPDAYKACVVSREDIYICDITVPCGIIKGDLALCLEVLEHIEEAGALQAVQNVCKAADTVIFSAAIPGQGGHGHINCQPKEYWETLFRVNGFYRNTEHEQNLISYMMSGYHMGWLTQNVMVLERK